MWIPKRAAGAAGLAAGAWMLAGAAAVAHVDGAGRASHGLGAPRDPASGSFHYVLPADAGALGLWVGGADGKGLCWILREAPPLDRADSVDLMISTVDGEVQTWPGDGWAFQDCAPAGTFTLCGRAVAVDTMAKGHEETVSVTLQSAPNNRGQRNTRTVSVTLTATGNARGAGEANWTAVPSSPNCAAPPPPADVTTPIVNPPTTNPPTTNPPSGNPRTTNPRCYSYQELVNGVCRSKCQSWQERVGVACVARCQAGETRVNGVCTGGVPNCKYGSLNGVCLPKPTTPPDSCPPGQTLVEGVCRKGKPVCKKVCAAGETLDVVECECEKPKKTTPTCPTPKVYLNGSCQCQSSFCSGGLVFKSTDCSCNTPTCKTGQVFKYGSCRCPNAGDVWLPARYHPPADGADGWWDPAGCYSDFSPYDDQSE